MDHNEFIKLLNHTVSTLQFEAETTGFNSSPQFEKRAREVVSDFVKRSNFDVAVNFDSHPQAFPDICLGSFGIEVKFTEKDTWRGVANSISQAMKDEEVSTIYVLWCKQGGIPEVRARPYEEVVMHVRTSHVPRFEIDMKASESLFSNFKLPYSEFSVLSMDDKMTFVRRYVRNRKRKGLKQPFWFLETQEIDTGWASTVRLYDQLSELDRRRLAVVELFLFSEIINKKKVEYQFDMRVLHFFNKLRILYPQSRALYLKAFPSDFDEHAVHSFLVDNSQYISSVYSEIPKNWLRENSEWWSADLTEPIATWHNILLNEL